MTTPADHAKRARCYRCLRPAAMCHCADLPTVATRTRVVILQHPHERTHPFGTARLARLCLPNATVHVPCAGFRGTLEQRVDVPADAIVLYPAEGAPLLQDLVADRRPSTLIAVDGTWSHAKRLYRDNTWLHHLPHARLAPAQPSRYRIRKEPRPDYISTLEAILEALQILEPDTPELEAPLLAFDRMIDRQIAHAASVQRFGRFKEARQRPSRTLSPLLFDPRLCVVYAESVLPGGEPELARELIQWVATRTDGAMFEALIQPGPVPPPPHHLAYMRLSPQDLAAAEPLAAAAARFRAWLPEGAPLAAWTATTVDWGRAMVPLGTAFTPLKTNYCNLVNRRAGFLEDVLRTEGLAPADVPCRGRAQQRLGNAVAIARWLQRQRSDLPAEPQERS